MYKKAQIALFVILAVLLISVIAIIAYTQREAFGASVKEESINPEILPIKTEIENCIQSTLERGIYLIGFQGGYIRPFKESIETNLSIISYAYYNDASYFPSLGNIEKQLEEYMNSMLQQCADFSKWPDFSVSAGKASSDVKINENSIMTKIIWPVTIKKESVFRLEKFEDSFPLKFYNVYNSAKTIVNNTADNPETIDMDYLMSLKEDYNMTSDIIPYGESFVYSLTYPEMEIEEKPYTFFIAVKP